MTKLRDRVVVLTDCSSALAYALAVQIAQEGAVLALWDCDLQRAERLGTELHESFNVQTRAYEVDLRNQRVIEEAMRLVARDLQQVHVVVHSSDLLPVESEELAQRSEKQIEDMLRVQTLSCVWITRAALPQMLESGSAANKRDRVGHFLFLSSSMTYSGDCRGLTDYAASKYALLGFQRALAHELRAMGKPAAHVQLSVVQAPLIREQLQKARPRMDPAVFAKKRLWIQADEVAKKSVRAIKRNKQRVVLPVQLAAMDALSKCLPQSWSDSLLDALGYSDGLLDPTAADR